MKKIASNRNYRLVKHAASDVVTWEALMPHLNKVQEHIKKIKDLEEIQETLTNELMALKGTNTPNT